MIKFTKMQGLGNDYVYIDAIHQNIENRTYLAQFVSNRNFGVGSDGLILVEKSDIADFKMTMFNSDGSQAEMCGNGIRCVAKFVYDKGLTDKTNLKIETLAGIKTLLLNVRNGKVETVRVDMGEPILEPTKIPVMAPENHVEIESYDKKFDFTCVSMGNPHAVAIVENVKDFDVKKYGKDIEINKIFPQKANIEFAEIVDRNTIKMRVWERGTGETLACGTGSCATAVGCALNGVTDRNVVIELLGGNLKIEWNENDNHVYMTGPAVTVFEGELLEK